MTGAVHQSKSNSLLSKVLTCFSVMPGVKVTLIMSVFSARAVPDGHTKTVFSLSISCPPQAAGMLMWASSNVESVQLELL